MGKTKYLSDIVLGERYRDEQTGYEGVATAICFFQHACERVTIETYDPVRKSVIEQAFDAPRLTSLKTAQVATSAKTGGPHDMPARPGVGAR